MNNPELDSLLEKIGLHRTYQLKISKPQAEGWDKIRKMLVEKEKNGWGILVNRYELSLRKITPNEIILSTPLKLDILYTIERSIFLLILTIHCVNNTSNSSTLNISIRMEYGLSYALLLFFVGTIIGILCSFLFVPHISFLLLIVFIFCYSFCFLSIKSTLSNFIEGLKKL